MSNSTLEIRRKFLAKAINHLMGYDAISGRRAADMYAQLLGYANNNNLHYALSIHDSKALEAVRYDWRSNAETHRVVSMFVPDITPMQIHAVDMMSRPDFAFINPTLEKWVPKLASLIKPIEDLNDLRWSMIGNAKSDGIGYLLAFMSGKPLTADKGRYRILCIVEAIEWLIQAGVVYKLRLTDIYVLFKLDNYEYFVDRLYDSFSDVEPKGRAGRFELERIKSLSDKEQFSLQRQPLFYSEYEGAFEALGVNTQTATLTPDVDNALFKSWDGLANYRRMKIEVRKLVDY